MRKVICLILTVVFVLSLSCSVFAAAPVNSAADGGVPSQTPNGDNPNTGDSIMNWVVLMVVAIIALAATTLVYRKFA